MDINNQDLILENNVLKFNSLANKGVNNLISLIPYNFRTTQISKEEFEEQVLDISNKNNLNFSKYIFAKQTHTNNVEIIDEKNINDEFEDVDGLVTKLKNIALFISVADCQGVVLYDEKEKILGNIHSGWKGTTDRILENAIKRFLELGSNPENIIVYFYPSISCESFEVDKDVKGIFESNFTDIDIKSCIFEGYIKEGKQKYHIDTVMVNKLLLLSLGIKEENINMSGIDTLQNKEFIHSHRGDGEKAGRNLVMAVMK